jgi:predicted ribosomally synthesized peptide with nif11-like leader
MSSQMAQEFIVKVQTDEALRSDVIALGQDLPGLVSLASKHGYTFTADDLKNAANAMGYATGKRISEDELSQVAGGTGTVIASTPPVTAWTSAIGRSCC